MLELGLLYVSLVIDRERSAWLTTPDRQLFVDATVTQQLNMFSSQSNFRNTECWKAVAASRAGAVMWLRGREPSESDSDHRQKTWPYSHLIFLYCSFWKWFINDLLNMTPLFQYWTRVGQNNSYTVDHWWVVLGCAYCSPRTPVGCMWKPQPGGLFPLCFRRRKLWKYTHTHTNVHTAAGKNVNTTQNK